VVFYVLTLYYNRESYVKVRHVLTLYYNRESYVKVRHVLTLYYNRESYVKVRHVLIHLVLQSVPHRQTTQTLIYMQNEMDRPNYKCVK